MYVPPPAARGAEAHCRPAGGAPAPVRETEINTYVKTQGRFFVLLDSFSVLDPTKPKTRLNHLIGDPA